MPLHLFRSKRPSSPKCKTIKKDEPPKVNTLPKDVPSKDENYVVDITNVGASVKENAVDKLPNGGHTVGAVLKGKEPNLATLVNELDATHSFITAQEAIREGCDPGVTQSPGGTYTLDDEPQPQQMAELLVGRQDSTSLYFTRRHISIPAMAIPSSIHSSTSTTSLQDTSVMIFPGLDPHAFELYQIWLHTGVISSRCQLPYDPVSETDHKYMWQLFWPLFNAHILGCKVEATNFVDQVMDLLEDKLSGRGSPDIDTIEHLFTKEGDVVPQVLRDFVVDQYIDGSVRGSSEMNISTLPPSFLHLTLRRALTRLSGTTSTSDASSCRYHTHATPELCYKQKIPTRELRRKQRLNFDRQKSSTDAQEVISNCRENGIKTVDWEERRAKTFQATRLQGTLVEDELGRAQTDGAADAITGLMSSQEATSTVDSGMVTRLLHPSLKRTVSGHLFAHFRDTSHDPGKKTRAKERSVVPGAFPVSRNGSQSSMLSNSW